MPATNSEDNVKERQIDAEIKKGIDARTKEFKEKIGKLAYERIKKQLAPPTEPLKGYPYNESIEEADSTSPNMAKAIQGLNDLGYKLKGRDGKDVQRVEKLFRSGNKKVLQGAMRALDTDIRDQIMDILEPLGFVKNGVVEEAASVDPKVAKAVEALNHLGYMLRGRRRFHSGVKRVETFFRSGNKKLLQGAIDVLDPDTRDDVMGILEPLGFVKNGVVEAVSKYTSFSTQNKGRKPSLGQSKLSSAEYQKVKKLKSFNADDWKWNGDLYIKVVESVDLEEKLKVSDGLGAWITDFKDSDAPQFKDTDEKKRRDMAIAAFVAAGGKLDEDTEIVKEAGYKIPKNYAQMIAKQKRNKPSLIQNKLSSAEYQKVKKLKSFNKDDWKWNGDLYIRVAEDVEFDEGKQMLKVSDMSESAMTLPQIANKYKGDIAKAQKSGNANSLKKAEKELIAWAMDNNEISNAKEAGDWLDNVVADKDQFDALLKYAKK